MAMLVIVVIYLLMLLLMMVPFALIWAGASYLLRKCSAFTRTSVFVIFATLLFTPGWAPATITIVLVPFGLLFGVAAINFSLGELLDVMRLAPPCWYFIAFPVTAAVIYCLRKLVLSNYSSKRMSTSTAQLGHQEIERETNGH
jgi:hypothetical protein